MVRKSPVASSQFDLEVHGKQTFVGELTARGEQDWMSLQPLRRKMAELYREAYLLNDEEVTVPWAGACNIQIPTQDKYKTRMRGPLRSLFGFGSPQHVQVRPGAGDSSVERAANLEMRINSVLRGDFAVYSQDDFSTQANFVVESLLQHGFGFLSPGYRYSTEVGSRQIRQRDLPGVLQYLSFIDAGVNRERHAAALEAAGINPNPEAVTALFGGEPINPVTPEVFDKHRSTFKQMVAEGFDLDGDDDLESAACDEIMTWMRGGAKGELVVLTRYVTHDHPELRYVEPHRLIAPGRADTAPSVASADRLFEIMPMTEGRLRSFGYDMGWERASIDKAAGAIGDGSAFGESDDEFKMEMLDRSGEINLISEQTLEGEVVEIVRSLREVKHRGAHVKVETYFEPRSGALLSHRLLPFNLPGWNYVRFSFEENEPGIYSPRGLPEVIQEPARYITAAHRSAMNGMIVSTTRGYFFDSRLGIDEHDPFWGPNVIRNVDLKKSRLGMTEAIREIAPVPGAAQEWRGEEFFLSAMVDDHVGENSAITRDSRLLEPITASENASRDRRTAQVQSTRGGLLVDSFARALTMMAAYDQQFMGDRAPVMLNGNARWLTPDDIRGSVLVRPSAGVGDMSPEFRASKAFNRLSVATQLVAQVPDLATDSEYRVNTMALFEEWLREDDPEAAARFLQRRSPEEQQQLAEQMSQQAEAAQAGQELATQAAQLDNEKTMAEIEKLRADAMASLEGGNATA